MKALLFYLATTLLVFSCEQSYEPPEVIYHVGETGPAGGIVFYDKGYRSNGWRYLEAAPNNQGSARWFTGALYEVGANGDAIGTGETNTATIVSFQNTGNAASICNDFSFGGYNDWFLPSHQEVWEMYYELYQKGIGNFSGGNYWTSTEAGSANASKLHTSGISSTYDKLEFFFIRPVRAF